MADDTAPRPPIVPPSADILVDHVAAALRGHHIDVSRYDRAQDADTCHCGVLVEDWDEHWARAALEALAGRVASPIRISPDGNRLAWYRPESDVDGQSWLVIDEDPVLLGVEHDWHPAADVADWLPLTVGRERRG